MADIKLNHEKLIIEVTKKFMNKANIYNSKENRELLAAQRDYPGFKVVVNKGKSGKEYYDGLDYDYMEKYIKDHDDEKKSIMEEYLTLRGKSDHQLRQRLFLYRMHHHIQRSMKHLSQLILLHVVH